MSAAPTVPKGPPRPNSNSDPAIARLEAEIRRLKSAVNELNVLNDLAISASSTLEIDPMLDTVVEKSIQALQAEQGSIMLLTEEADDPLKTLIRQDRRTRLMTYRVGINITGWVLKHQKPLLIKDLATDSRFRATPRELEEIKSLLCVPIFFKGDLLGILMVTNKRRGEEPFSEEDRRLLVIIAAQSGQLIRNRQLQEEALEKQRLEQELQLARNIQLSLIPQAEPSVKHLQVASYFQAAAEVGGDYFDFFSLGEDQLGVVIADVSGHGPSAALIMTMLKGMLRAFTQKFHSGDQLLSEVNQIMSEIAPPEIFVTMTFMVFDMSKRRLRYANAGHNPFVYYNRPAGTWQLEKFYSPALSLTPRAQYSERELPLNAGDVVMIYTDGVTEALDEAGNMFREEGLLKTARKSGLESARRIVTQTVQAVNSFTGKTPQNDDRALIVVKVDD